MIILFWEVAVEVSWLYILECVPYFSDYKMIYSLSRKYLNNNIPSNLPSIPLLKIQIKTSIGIMALFYQATKKKT